MPRVKLGKPLPPVKGDIPIPSDAEIALLISNWDTYAPARYKGMLSARPVGTDDPKARWFYDDERKRYVSRGGHVVTPKELRLAYLEFKKAMNERR